MGYITNGFPNILQLLQLKRESNSENVPLVCKCLKKQAKVFFTVADREGNVGVGAVIHLISSQMNENCSSLYVFCILLMHHLMILSASSTINGINIPQRLIWHDKAQFFFPQLTKEDECRPVQHSGPSLSPRRRAVLMSSPTVSPSGSTLALTIAQATEGAVQQTRFRVGFTVNVTITGKAKPATFYTARITVAAQITAIVTWLARSSASAMTAGKVRDLFHQGTWTTLEVSHLYIFQVTHYSSLVQI